MNSPEKQIPGEEESTVERTCLACGYNLFGLGDEPRCPECGLLNIPQGYRQQVWDLVDSGRWFFSPFLNPFRKRPPGWWWSLDREGDLKRARRAACRNILLAMAIVFTSCAIADSLVCEVTREYTSYAKDRQTEAPLHTDSLVVSMGIAGILHGRIAQPDWHQVYGDDRVAKMSLSKRIVLALPTQSLSISAPCALGLLLAWLGPAMVGMWTQIREGLPDFAHPPDSIRAASYYESHRTIYGSFVVMCALAVDFGCRYLNFFPDKGRLFVFVFIAWWIGFSTFAACSWIGPVRSDYTKQLVRSRFHAGRIIIVYAGILPFVTVLAAALFVELMLYY